MEYWLYTGLPSSCIDDILIRCQAIVSSYVTSYIWQCDVFNLRKIDDEGGGGCATHLYGCVEYGDNVGDLWFICFLLHKLSSQIPGLVIKVCDTDGEFLLIEAADVLPKWVNPKTAVNRVYLYEGNLHLISPSVLSEKEELSVNIAVEYVRENPTNTIASDQIQSLIAKRLSRYPEQALKEIHGCRCYLPMNAAQLLSEYPQLVSDAVRAFYHRDALDIKACQHMTVFPPDSRVLSKVKLTRCLYAQLMQQKFYPPKRSMWNIPPVGDADHQSHDLGMKIAFGLEILCSTVKKSDSNSDAAYSHISDDDVTWNKYLEALQKVNYFQGQIEGSVKYKELWNQAKLFFSSSRELSSPDSDRSFSAKGSEILTRLQNLSISEAELREKEKDLPPDDDDSWLYMTLEDLDELFKEYSDSSGSAPTATAPQPFDPSVIPESMSSFIKKQSNLLSGVEPPNSNILFDSKTFLDSVEKLMNGGDEELDSDDDSLDEYESDDSKSETAELSKAPTNKQQATAPDTERVEEHDADIEDFMDMMDRELSKTNVGKSFERLKMDKQKSQKLPDHNSSAGRATLATAEEDTLDLDNDEDDGSLKPVDVDFNAVKNLLESYSHQMGLPGPTSTLLGSMGIQLPPNTN